VARPFFFLLRHAPSKLDFGCVSRIQAFLQEHAARLLSQSLTASVYLCSPREGHPFVLKVYASTNRYDSSCNRTVEEQFSRELSVLVRLSHPHIQRLQGWGWLADTQAPFLILAYAPGQDARNAAQALSHSRLLSLSVQLARTIEFCHRRGVIHGDIAPSNIVIGESGIPPQDRITLVDFASSRTALSSSTCSSLTLTPDYAAPELLVTREPTPATDIYSLGLVLTTLFESRPSSATGPSAPKSRDSIAQDLKPLLARMTHQRPEQRISSAGRVAVELSEIARTHGVPTDDFTIAPYVSAVVPAGLDVHLRDVADLLTHARAATHAIHYIQILGPPGSGKSTLAREIAWLCSQQGYLVDINSPSASGVATTRIVGQTRPRLLIYEHDLPIAPMPL